MIDSISDSNTGVPIRTIENAVSALLQSFSYSPLGEQINNCTNINCALDILIN